MIKKTGMVLVLIALTAGVLKLANAKTAFMDKFDANYSSSPLKGNCIVCHTSPPRLNPYGTAYEKGDKQFNKIESQDSDGDGFANLTEILAGTFPGDPTSNPSSPPVTDGPTLYAQNCAGCHGPLAQSKKLGRTDAQIQAAINANVGNMGGLSSLTAAHVQAIADALAGQTPPPPLPPPPPTADGPTLYAQSCASCHGPLAQSTKIGRTAAQIQDAINANVGSMGILANLTPSHVQAIADALAQKKADTTPPKVTSFSISPTSSSLTVTINVFAATDDVGVTGYMITESPTAPLPADPKWSSSAPSNYTFTTPGSKTLYGWAKDAAGKVSSGVSATTTISSTTPPSTPEEAPDLTVWVGKWFKLTEKNTGYQYVNPGLTKMNASYTGYLKIWEWDPVNKVLRADQYEQNTQSGQWVSFTLTLNFFGGTQLDFLCWSQETTEDYRTGFTAHVYGQEKSGELAKASFKSLGGFYLSKKNPEDSASANQNVGGVTITGVLISGQDVPVPQSLLVH